MEEERERKVNLSYREMNHGCHWQCTKARVFVATWSWYSYLPLLVLNFHTSLHCTLVA